MATPMAPVSATTHVLFAEHVYPVSHVPSEAHASVPLLGSSVVS